MSFILEREVTSFYAKFSSSLRETFYDINTLFCGKFGGPQHVLGDTTETRLARVGVGLGDLRYNFYWESMSLMSFCSVNVGL